MFRYIANRLLLAIPTLIGVAIITFFMLRVLPGDIVEAKLRGDGAQVTTDVIERERARLGLDKPRSEQFARLDERARAPRPRQVDVDRPSGDRGSRRAISRSPFRSH